MCLHQTPNQQELELKLHFLHFTLWDKQQQRTNDSTPGKLCIWATNFPKE